MLPLALGRTSRDLNVRCLGATGGTNKPHLNIPLSWCAGQLIRGTIPRTSNQATAQERAEPVQKGTQEALPGLFLDELFTVGSLVGGDDLFREFVKARTRSARTPWSR